MPGSLSPPDLIAYEVQVNRRDIEGEGLPVASLADPPPPRLAPSSEFFTPRSQLLPKQKNHKLAHRDIQGEPAGVQGAGCLDSVSWGWSLHAVTCPGSPQARASAPPKS